MSGRRASRGDSAAWSVVWAFAGTVASRLLWLAALAVLARLIAPQEFGLLAFALVYITYVETIADLGTGAALIYWPERREEAAQVTFVSNAVAGFAWCAITLVAAPWIADFFNSPAGVPILRALALSFPLKFLGTTHDALCQKEMRFRVRLVPEVAMALGKSLVAVGLALAGFGVWSLVWGQIAGLAAWTAALWIVVPWRPSWSWPRDLAKPMLSYGRGIIAVNVLAAITHHADLVIVGRMLGARVLGLYQMAYKVPEMAVIVSVWVVSKVLFPAFSRAHAAGEEVGALYVAALRWISLLAVPASLGLALVAEPLVITLFGEPWRDAVPILQALALYTGLRALGSHAGDVLKATGRPGLLAAISIAKAALMVPLLLLAVRSGPVAVALTMAGVTALTIFFNVVAVCRLTQVTPRALLAALRPSLLAGAGMAAVLLGWQRLAPAGEGPLALATAVALGAASYLLLLRLMNPGLLPEMRQALARRRAVAEVRP
ncbi:MAG TPA: lipopolysaccharide biosynthesis protein [Thermoanaerobaculia bacterium]